MAEECHKALEKSVNDYYKADKCREERLQQILTKKIGFSLREIDWFVTNMAARKPQIYRNPKTGKVVNVNSEYKDVLRCYHKMNFDSFKRKYTFSKISDLKQRNFFRWALEYGIVDYVADNIIHIKKDMAKNKKTKKTETSVPLRKRQRGEGKSTVVMVKEEHEVKIPTLGLNLQW